MNEKNQKPESSLFSNDVNQDPSTTLAVLSLFEEMNLAPGLFLMFEEFLQRLKLSFVEKRVNSNENLENQGKPQAYSPRP